MCGVQLTGAVAPEYGMNLMRSGVKPDDIGLVNQYGQSRKVSLHLLLDPLRIAEMHVPR